MYRRSIGSFFVAGLLLEPFVLLNDLLYAFAKSQAFRSEGYRFALAFLPLKAWLCSRFF
jgi:hypothetical protein